MKKVISLSLMCLMALSICLVFSCTKNDDESNSSVESNSGVASEYNASDCRYIDLGLPSGTKWKASNEINAADAQYDFFTYDEAVSRFGNSLPTEAQCEELIDRCQWMWNGSGYRVTGPNGNYIVLPAAGLRNCSGSVDYVGYYGNYWSSTPKDSDYAWDLYFSSGIVCMYDYSRCYGFSVRLVQD